MDVKLAGFNVDLNAIKEVKNILHNYNKDGAVRNSNRRVALNLLNNLTQETICASYARISRDPRNISELKKDARRDVENARKSNQAIIFTMGHKSIAENMNLVNRKRGY